MLVTEAPAQVIHQPQIYGRLRSHLHIPSPLVCLRHFYLDLVKIIDLPFHFLRGGRWALAEGHNRILIFWQWSRKKIDPFKWVSCFQLPKTIESWSPRQILEFLISQSKQTESPLPAQRGIKAANLTRVATLNLLIIRMGIRRLHKCFPNAWTNEGTESWKKWVGHAKPSLCPLVQLTPKVANPAELQQQRSWKGEMTHIERSSCFQPGKSLLFWFYQWFSQGMEVI